MTNLTQKSSKQFFGAAMRVVTLALFLAVLGASAALRSFAYVAPDDQVPFTITGTGVVTDVTHLPGGLTQLDFSLAGNATHLGDFTGTVIRIQDHQGNFTSSSVLVGANGTNSIFLSIGGHFESPDGKCVVVSTGTFIVTGGTGAFANATGSGTTRTEVDVCAVTGSGTYTGTISRPNSN